jgi:protein ImuB
MPRIACVVVPHFAVQSLRRADAELATAPLVVAHDKEIIDVSVEAARLGLRAGLTVSQVRAVAPEAVIRARSAELERSAAAALDDLATSFSPRVEPHGAEVALDVSDLGRLFDSEGAIASALYVGARKLGLEARVGLARDKTTARVAALAGDGVTVVPQGREPAFLAPLPVALLLPSDEVRLTLERWGVRTIGELATLPTSGLGLRLGAEGARLAQVARGEAELPLVPRTPPVMFEEAIDFEWPVENVEALLFVLKRLFENLTARLAARGLGAGNLELHLGLERSLLDPSARAGGGREIRPVAVAAPTREAQTLLQLARVSLESAPVSAPVTSLAVRVSSERTRAAQLGLFAPAGPSPDKLATLLARLGALVGEGRVGAPAILDRHLPDAFSVTAFEPARPPAARAPVRAEIRQLALHAFRPPRAAAARLDRGRLRTLHADGLGGQVVTCAGPFRVRDGWWQTPLYRDYYDVELSDGAIYRVFHDLHADAWHVDGCYE